MSETQSEVYECARNTASLKIDNTEWVNEFSEGIILNKGDQVRLLGSFVHEGSSGEEIELLNDTEININFSPFLQLNTLNSNDKNNPTLVDLGRTADIPYSTDAFGVEPIFWETKDAQAVTGVASYQYPLNTDNPIATGTQDNRSLGTNAAKWNSRTIDPTTAALFPKESAKTWGINIKTDEESGNIQNGTLNYNNFAFNNIPQELYIAQIVKKLILPFMDGIKFITPGLDGNGIPAWDPIVPRYNQFPILNDAPPTTGPGMLNGTPKPGMCIATVDIGASSGWYDENGVGYFENRWDNSPTDSQNIPYIKNTNNKYIGIPNLKSGVQSVIGTILAVRPIYHNIEGRRTGCYELYVSNWVNPGSIYNKKISHNFPAGHITQAKNTISGTLTPGPGFAETILYKQIHGAGLNDNNYNINPSFNNINSSNNDYDPTKGDQGCYLGTPFRQNYSNEAGCSNYEAEVVPGSSTQTPNEYQYGYGQPQGISNLWNGSHQGSHRYTYPVDIDTLPRRLNYTQQWITDGAAPATIGDGMSGIWAEIGGNDGKPYVFSPGGAFPDTNEWEQAPHGLIPQVIGGYIICKKETMEDIVKGTYDTLDDPNYYSGTPGLKPRVWFEYSFQQKTSNNKQRHMVDNSWDNPAGYTQLGIGVSPNYAERIGEIRNGYTFCGQPLSAIYRASRAIPRNINLYLPGGTPQGYGVANSNDSYEQLQSVDYMPRSYSSITGLVEWTQADPPTSAALKGVPYVNCIYNNTINSVHFQQKETGDTDLGGGNNIMARGFSIGATATGSATILIPTATLLEIGGGGGVFVPAAGDFIRILYSNSLYPYQTALFHDVAPIAGVVLAGANWIITLDTGSALVYNGAVGPNAQPRSDYKINYGFPDATKIFINRGASYLGSGNGVLAEAWNSDMLMIKESLVKLKVPSGYYTEEQLAENINNQLHLNNQNYGKELGDRLADNTFSVPATTSGLDQALTSVPSVFNGNFVQTYIPDLSYAFSPITQTSSTTTGLIPSTRDMTEITYDYLQYGGSGGGRQFYYSEEIDIDRPSTGINVSSLNNIGTNGKHFKCYSVPYNAEPGMFNPNLQLVRLRGGALGKTDWDATNNVWGNQITRWCGSYENMRDDKGDLASSAVAASYAPIFAYRTRLNRNLLSWGGGAKLFCGANNITFSWEEGANRFSLNNLYTPIRPHEPINPKDTSGDFGIEDAIPSAIINAEHTGEIVGQLTGVYINELNGDAFNELNWGQAPCGTTYKYDTHTNAEIQILGRQLLDALGYSEEQLLGVNNSFNIVSDLFVFKTYQLFYGQAIRVAPKLTTALNGSNPYASNCLNIAPVAQFFVECETNDFFAINVPSKGTDPYYFIGSDFPSKYFYGALEGQKLPVMGICARNFHSFNFVFDLGASSITYTITENTTIKSIRTKIYTSTLGTPSSLSPYSSVIYLITRNKYAPNLTEQEIPLAIQEQQANAAAPIIGDFYNPPLAAASFPQAFPPPNFYIPMGSPPPPDTDDDTDSEEEY
tara:strand:+ start:582 stop:5114 length:4533 start_codon:yes stop_codon:yes gene_type:complete